MGIKKKNGFSWTKHRSWRAFFTWFYSDDLDPNGSGIHYFGHSPCNKLCTLTYVRIYTYIRTLISLFLLRCTMYFS